MARWTEDDIWRLLKNLSPATAGNVGNRLCSGINFKKCSAKEIVRWMEEYSRTKKLPTEAELTEAILIEIFGSLTLPESVLKKIKPKE